MPFAVTWRNLEMIILSKISQKEKDKYHTISLICGIENLKEGTNEPSDKTETDSQTQRSNLWLPRQGAGEGCTGSSGLVDANH